MVSENTALRRIFGARRDDEIADRRKRHNEELHNVYTSQNIIKKIRSSRIKLTGHVAPTSRSEMHIRFW
jgi:predicted small metal-binding protein